MRNSLLLVFGLTCLFAVGCAGPPVSSRKVVALERFHHVFVISELNDNHRIDELLAAELKRLGYEASFGPRTMMPDNADAVITYADRWEWDFKTYLIELKLEAFTSRTNKKLAEARYYRPSLRSESPEQIVHDLLLALQ